MIRIIISLFILLLCYDIANAQILRRIRNQTIRKVEQRIENKIVDAVSDELARRAYRPVEKAIDDMLRESFKDSLDSGEEVDWEKAGEAYTKFLQGMNEAADLPDTYNFDLSMQIEMKDYDEKTTEMIMHFSKTTSTFGMENLDEKDQKQLIVIDLNKDLIVLYTTDKKGNKSAQAIPSMMGFMSTMAAGEATEQPSFTVEKTNTTKTILGYRARKYISNTEEENIESFVAEDFPINWQDNFGVYMKKFAPAAFAEQSNEFKGMVLSSESTLKEKPTNKSTWNTTHISHTPFEVVNADYQFKPLVPEENN